MKAKTFLLFLLLLSLIYIGCGEDGESTSDESDDSFCSNPQNIDHKRCKTGPTTSNDSDDDSNEYGDYLDESALVTIPAGSFKMGCSPGDPLCLEDEFPVHTVTLSEFRIMKTEVTQEMFEDVMGYNPSSLQNCLDCPVELVTWDEANAFCKAVGGALPTEAQWEYAARGGTTTRYHCGDDPECLQDVAWIGNNAKSITHPVAQKEPNGFGLFDMHGNVSEWIMDFYQDDYYSVSPKEDPKGPVSGDHHILRGGGFNCLCNLNVLRTSYRYIHRIPVQTAADLGFRCVMN